MSPRGRLRGVVAAVLSLLACAPTAALAAPGTTLATAACGSWSMLQVSKTTALTYFRPSINASLAIPGVKGLSLRAPWNAVASSLAIYQDGVTIARADRSALAIRFIAGYDTPSQDLGNTTVVQGHRIPLPWGSGTTPTHFVPNQTFETAYRGIVSRLATFAKANGVHVLHLSWYGAATAEIYLGPEIVNAPGYSLQNFLTGYERLLNIGRAVVGPGLALEFPLSGVGTRPVVIPLEKYMAATYGQVNPDLMAQFNSLTDSASAPTPPADGVNVTRQMNGQGDFNWNVVYQTLRSEGSHAVEIYLQSFASNLAHYSALRTQVASFASTC